MYDSTNRGYDPARSYRSRYGSAKLPAGWTADAMVRAAKIGLVGLAAIVAVESGAVPIRDQDTQEVADILGVTCIAGGAVGAVCALLKRGMRGEEKE